MLRNLLILLAITYVFVSCDSSRAFQSVSGVESQLTGTWKQVPIPDKGEKEIWEFNNGNITISYVNDSFPSQNIKDVLHGTYEVVTTLSTPYVFVYGVPTNFYNGRWSVIRIDSKVLSMNRATEGTNALNQEEFLRLK